MFQMSLKMFEIESVFYCQRLPISSQPKSTVHNIWSKLDKTRSVWFCWFGGTNTYIVMFRYAAMLINRKYGKTVGITADNSINTSVVLFDWICVDLSTEVELILPPKMPFIIKLILLPCLTWRFLCAKICFPYCKLSKLLFDVPLLGIFEKSLSIVILM